MVFYWTEEVAPRAGEAASSTRECGTESPSRSEPVKRRAGCGSPTRLDPREPRVATPGATRPTPARRTCKWLPDLSLEGLVAPLAPLVRPASLSPVPERALCRRAI